MAPKEGDRLKKPGFGSILPPPPGSQRPTLQLPSVRTDVEGIHGLLDAGPSPLSSEWPDAPERYSDVGDRPTPPAFVLPDMPGKGIATLTLIRGLDAGRVYRLDQERSLLGRSLSADVRIDDEAVSRCHACIVRDAKGRHTIEDLGSTNGTFVRGRPLGKVAIGSGDRVQLGPNVLFRFAFLTDDEGSLQENLFESAVRDGLTGVFNRASLWKLIDEALREVQHNGRALSVLMIDLDHFKQINDQLGHAAGDEILQAVASSMKSVIRNQDSVARYGGEEFVVIARCTQLWEACGLAERLRKAIATVRVPTEQGVAMTTASIGVASLSECTDSSGSALLKLADERMYEAKRNGRNCVWP